MAGWEYLNPYRFGSTRAYSRDARGRQEYRKALFFFFLFFRRGAVPPQLAIALLWISIIIIFRYVAPIFPPAAPGNCAVIYLIASTPIVVRHPIFWRHCKIDPFSRGFCVSPCPWGASPNSLLSIVFEVVTSLAVLLIFFRLASIS